MALKFKVDPLSFRVTRELREQLWSDPKDKERNTVIFGYIVRFSHDKLSKGRSALSSPKHRLKETGFVDFLNDFASFLALQSVAELDVARAGANASRDMSVYPVLGYYTLAGKLHREYTSSERASTEKPRVMSFDDIARENDSLRERERERRQAEEDLRNAAGMSDGLGRSRKTDHTAASEENHYRTGGGSENRDGTRSKGDGGRRDRGESGSTNTANDNKAAMSEEQAAKIVEKSAELDLTLPSKQTLGKWNLTTTQRDKRFEEVHVPVARGDYAKVTSGIVRGKPGGYVITGPTGCGKSTVALLPLFKNPKATVLVVEPTQANAANIFHEFTNILPNMVARGVISGPVPVARFVAPTVSRPPFPQLLVTTTDKFLEYLYFRGLPPPADFVVLDEFHLPIPPMVECVEYLRTFAQVKKYVLVSATAPGFQVNYQLPRGVTTMPCRLRLGVVPDPIDGSDLDPRRWYRVGDGTIAVVAPSIAVAQRLFRKYADMGCRSFLITRKTTVTDYMRAATDYAPKTVFVLEPGVEAGVTLSISVLISMGTTTAIRYDGKVVVEDTQPLDAIAAAQRGGRGGRVKPTIYMSPIAPDGGAVESTASYFRAQAVIKMVAMGAQVEKMRVDGLLETFPKLATLSKALAASAVAAGGDPFLAVYKTNEKGRVYIECGGDGEGFARLASKELFVYKYAKGFFVSPVADFSDINSKPDTFVTRQSQYDAATAIVESLPGLEEKYKLAELVDLFVSKFDGYVTDFFVRMQRVFTKPAPENFVLSGTDKAAEVEDFVSSSEPLVKLFAYLKTEPPGVVYDRRSESRGAKHRFVHGRLALNYAFDDKYKSKSGGSLDVGLLADAVYRELRGLLCIEMLLDGAPSKCVDLEQYKGRVAPEHLWFKNFVAS